MFKNFQEKIFAYLFVILLTFFNNLSDVKASNAQTDLLIEEVEDISPPRTATTTSIPSKTRMPFKLGFEFQEATGLCNWAQHDFRVQKKKLFEVIDKASSKPLWHIVIDSSDIEFVTEPFSYEERTLLQKSMRLIVHSTNFLHTVLNQERKITFGKFREKIVEDASIDVKIFETYNFVKDCFLSIDHIPLERKWTPYFSPQATIQHPLEYTIPLYFSLFGFDNEYMPNFSASLPLKGSFLKAQKEGDGEELRSIIRQFKTKRNGLVFLHALTLTCMAPADYPSIQKYLEGPITPEITEILRRTISLDLASCSESLGKIGKYIQATQIADTKQLTDTLEASEKYDQVDPKMSLTLMSRRPFSQMLKDIKGYLNGSYMDYFRMVMQENISFFDVPRLLSKVSYAEQFYDFTHGSPRDLSFLIPFFKETFLKTNEEIITKLLRRGIVSTTMLRNFTEDVKLFKTPFSNFFESYYNFSLQSVDNPTGNIKLDVSDENFEGFVKPQSWAFDVLSPPLILDANNSMGRFRDDKQIDKVYGEAIIEVRGIRSVKPWFLKKCGLTEDISGLFLVNPENVERHSLTLCDYLDNFASSDSDYSIFEAGFSHALRQY